MILFHMNLVFLKGKKVATIKHKIGTQSKFFYGFCQE